MKSYQICCWYRGTCGHRAFEQRWCRKINSFWHTLLHCNRKGETGVHLCSEAVTEPHAASLDEQMLHIYPHVVFSLRQAAVQAAGSAGMELKNIVEFYRQWKEIG